MRFIVDTNVAIHLRDGNSEVVGLLAGLPVQPAISILTRVELEGGVYRDPGAAPLLRTRVDLLLSQFPSLPFKEEEAEAYGRIVAQCGFSRARIVDRMIAATAIVADATLITMNGGDFRGIDELKLEVWSSPTD